VAKAKTKVSKRTPAKKKPVIKKASSKASAKEVVKKKVATKKLSAKKKTATTKRAVSKIKPAPNAVLKKKAGTKKKLDNKKSAVKKAPAKTAVTEKKSVAKKAPANKKSPIKKNITKPADTATKPTPKRKRKSSAPAARPSPIAPTVQRPRIVRKLINLEDVKIPLDYTPSAKDEYMNVRHLAYFKRMLLAWRDELIVESQETLEHLRTETRDVGDEAERASRESDNILELRTRDRYRKLLRKIEEAIKRIEEGDYGFCEETGEEIGLGRLEARPIATLTVDAQERRELFQKQFRDDR